MFIGTLSKITAHLTWSQFEPSFVEHWKLSSAGFAARSLSVAHVGVTVAGGGVGEEEGVREGVREGATAGIVVTGEEGEGVVPGRGHGR